MWAVFRLSFKMADANRSSFPGDSAAVTSEDDWRRNHPPPVWLPGFEQTAVAVVGPNHQERVEGERLLKKWVQQQASPTQELLRVIETTTDVRVIVVAVLLCRNAAFKMWARSLEEVELAEQLRGGVPGGGQGGQLLAGHLECSAQSSSQEVTLGAILKLVEGLVHVGFNRWDDSSPDSVICRNQIFGLVTLLVKKGWSQSTCSAEMRFYPLVQSLMSTVVKLCESILAAGPMHQQLSHANLMCFRLLIDICRGMASTDIANVGIGWEDYMDAKKLFERQILAPLVPEILSFLRVMAMPTAQGTNSVPFNSIGSSDGLPSRLQVMCGEPNFVTVVEYIVDLLEVFLDWEFSYTRCQALIPVESWFMPTDNWYSVLFEIPVSASASSDPRRSSLGSSRSSVEDSSSASSMQSTLSTTLFTIVIDFYRIVRTQLFSSHSSFSRCAKLFCKSRSALNRVSHFRPTRMRSRFVSSSAAANEYQLQLTRTLYSPLFFAVAELIGSSIFITQGPQLLASPLGSETAELRSLAVGELQCLTHSLARIVDNVEVDVASLLTSDRYVPTGEVLERCFTYLMSTVAAFPEGEDRDEEIVASVENLSVLFYKVALEASSWDVASAQRKSLDGSDAIVVPPWAVPFTESASRITQHLLGSCLQLFALHDEGADIEKLTSDMPTENQYVSVIQSPFVNDALREFAVIGQCRAAATAHCLHAALENRLTALQQQMGPTPSLLASEASPAVSTLCDELLWLLGYCCYFIVQPHDRTFSSNATKRIPRAFILQRDDCPAQILRLFTLVTRTLLTTFSSGSKTAMLPPSLVEASFCVLQRFSEGYLFQSVPSVGGRAAFPEFTSADSGREALNGIIVAVDHTLSAMPHEPAVCRAALDCLLTLASPLTPTITYLWESLPFQNLLCRCVQDACQVHATTQLGSLRTKDVIRLCRAFASATSSSEHIRTAARAHATLERSGSTVSLSIAQNRFTQLTNACFPVKDTLVILGAELQLKQQQAAQNAGNPHLIRMKSEREADPTRIFYIERLFAVCTGIARGTVDHTTTLVEWLRPITTTSVPAVAKSYMLYPLVLRSILKYLYYIGRPYLATQTPRDYVGEYFSTVQLFTEAFAQCYGQGTATDDLDDDSSAGAEESSVTEELIENISLLFRILTYVLNQAASLQPSDRQGGPGAADGSQGQLILGQQPAASSDQTWSPRLVMASIAALDPVLRRAGALSDDNIRLVYANLLFQLFEQHADVVVSLITGPVATCYCHAITEALLSSNTRCQTAASEALGSCTKFLAHHQRKAQMISYALTTPEGTPDIFSDTPNPADVLAVFEHEVAQMGLRLLLQAVGLPRSASKRLEFYSDSLCDVFTFLAIKLYNLKRLFDQFSQLYCYDSLRLEKCMAHASFMKAVDPLLVHFREYSQQSQQAVDNGQSSSLQQIKYTQYRTKFRQLFDTLILACRVGSQI